MQNTLNRILMKIPFLSAAILIALSILLPPLLAGIVRLEDSQIFDISFRYVVSLCILALLIYLGWGKASGVSNGIKTWHSKWVFLMLPILGIGLLNLTSVDWNTLNATPNKLAIWALDNIAVGLYEEILMRGLVLYILVRAWGKTRKGLLKAVLVQAVIFGFLHYLNLTSGASFESVSVQVIYAIFFGIGFGGLTLLARSIWPGVIAHAAIDAMSSINEGLGTISETTHVPEMTISESLIAIIIIFILAAISGILYTRRASLRV